MNHMMSMFDGRISNMEEIKEMFSAYETGDIDLVFAGEHDSKKFSFSVGISSSEAELFNWGSSLLIQDYTDGAISESEMDTGDYILERLVEAGVVRRHYAGVEVLPENLDKLVEVVKGIDLNDIIRHSTCE